MPSSSREAFEASNIRFPLAVYHGTTKADFIRVDPQFFREGFGRSENGVGFYAEPHGETAWEYAGGGETPGVVLKTTVEGPEGWLHSAQTVTKADVQRVVTAALLLGHDHVARSVAALSTPCPGRDLFAAAQMKSKAGCEAVVMAGWGGYYAAGDANFVFLSAVAVPDLTVHAVYRNFPVADRPVREVEAPARVQPSNYKSEDLRQAHFLVVETGDSELGAAFEALADMLHAPPVDDHHGYDARRAFGIDVARALRSGLIRFPASVVRVLQSVDPDVAARASTLLGACRMAWASGKTLDVVRAAGHIHALRSNDLVDFAVSVRTVGLRTVAGDVAGILVEVGDPTLRRDLTQRVAVALDRYANRGSLSDWCRFMADVEGLVEDGALNSAVGDRFESIASSLAVAWEKSLRHEVGARFVSYDHPRRETFDAFFSTVSFDGWKTISGVLDSIVEPHRIDVVPAATAQGIRMTVTFDDGRSLRISPSGEVLQYRDGRFVQRGLETSWDAIGGSLNSRHIEARPPVS
jgi:hypothetical protein